MCPELAGKFKLLVVTKSENMMEAALSSMENTMRHTFSELRKGQQISPEQQRIRDAAQEKLVNVMREEISWEKFKKIYIAIYKETFTQEEIDGLIAFYKSPAGSAFVEKMPIVIQKVTVEMQSIAAPVMEKMRVAARQIAVEAGSIK